MRNYKRIDYIRYLLTSALVLGVLLLGWGVACYLIDPLSLHHCRVRKPYLPAVGQARFRNPGLIINYGYRFEGAVIGNSLSANFLPEQIKQRLGFYPLHLTADGSRIYEQSLTVRLALRHNPHFKKVLWGVQGFFYPHDNVMTEGGLEFSSIPLELYDTSWINDFKYYYSFSIIPYIEKKLFRNPRTVNNSDYNWMKSREKFFLRSPREKGYTSDVFVNQKSDPQNIINTDNNIKYNIAPVLQAYPDVEFIFVLPPVSFAHYKVDLAAYRHIVEAMYGLSRKYPNAKVYNFMLMKDIATNIELYCDLGHYSEDISNLVIDKVGLGEYLLDDDSLAESIAVFDYYSTVSEKMLGLADGE